MSDNRLAALQFLAAGLLGGAWLGYSFHQALERRIAADFAPLYSAGRIVRTQGPGRLYDFSAMEQTNARYFNSKIVLPFIRPPAYALFLAAFTYLRPHPALLVWMCLNTLALAVAIVVIARVTDLETSAVACHAAVFFPALYAFFLRQDVPLLLVPASLGYLLAMQGRDFRSGLVLSLCAVKFHLLFLIPLVFLAKKNWRALGGLSAGVGVLLFVSGALVGPAGLASYGRMLMGRNAPNMEYPERIVNLWNLAGHAWWAIPLGILTAGLVLQASRRLPLREGLAAGWLGSLLVAPHIYLSDYLFAFPACLILSRVNRFCFLTAVLILFPLTLILLPYNEAFLLATPLLVLACLAGASLRPVSPATSATRRPVTALTPLGAPHPAERT